MHCLTCGTKNPDGAIYCGQCGSALGPAPREEQAAFAPPARPYTFRRLALVGSVFVGIFAFLMLIFGATALALALALIPTAGYVTLAVWVDRYEPDPWWLLGGAFLWGASVATFVAYLVNSLGAALVSSEFGKDVGNVYGSSVSAPIVEEAAKGAVLLFVFLRRREELNGLLDGVVYASMVGLGFAMTENVLYYVNNTDSIGTVFVMRGLLTPFLHPLFTAMTGVGLVLALRARTRRMRIVAPIVGFGAAVGLHSIWNTTAGAGLLATLAVGLGLFIPVLVMFAILLRRTVRHEADVIREYLPAGTVPPEDVERLSSLKSRIADALRSIREGGLRGFAAREEYVAALSDLAFDRYHESRAQAAAPSPVRESARDVLADLRREWRSPTTR